MTSLAREIVRTFFDEKSTSHHETINLKTKGEKVKIIALYCCKKYNTLDLSFKVNHLAEDTSSEIYVYGILMDYAQKSCRLEINFQNGTSGSKGIEREEVFLLSDKAKNISIPTINCSEKDVKGSHGASVGHIDKTQKNYLISRGLPESQAKKLLVSSLLKKPLPKISNDSLRRNIESKLTNSIVAQLSS